MRSSDKIVTSIRFTPGSESEQRTGMLGWVACSHGLVRLDGIAVRKTLDGRLTLSFPRGRGRHPSVRPLDDEARLALEREVFLALGMGEGGR